MIFKVKNQDGDPYGIRTRVAAVAAIIMATVSFAHAADLIDLPNFYQHSDNLYTSGQPKADDFSGIAKSGIHVVVNMSPVNLPASLRNEKKLVEQYGMTYHFIPIDWDKPTINDVRKFFKIMEENQGKSVLVHCWVNARASGFVYLLQTIERRKVEKEERNILSNIWENNGGYELRNVPMWNNFFAEVQKSTKP